MNQKNKVQMKLNEIKSQLIELSHKIHAHPEIGFKEEKAAAWIADALEGDGFKVERGSAGLATAFIATKGKGPLHIGICAEYDALPGVGHACGHNIIASSAVGASIAAATIADALDCRITVFGTPGEENGGGKINLLEGGAFDGVHAAMMIHPAPVNLIAPTILACESFWVEYTGVEAHSSMPQKGINAADALTVAQTAIGLMRQHIHPTDRVHGIITKGGDAPNIVPAHTQASYCIRSRTLADLDRLRDRVLNCFKAGALATGSKMNIIQNGKTYAQMDHDLEIATLFKHNAKTLGRVFLDDVESMPQFSISTDMGNISLRIPSIHPMIAVKTTVANHHPDFAAACHSPSADQALYDGALAMAWTIIDMAMNEQLKTRLMNRIIKP